MIEKIIYRQALESDKENLFSFYKEVYPDTYKIKCSKQWEREFSLNPYKPEGGVIGTWIALDGLNNKIVGQTSVIYESFCISKKKIVIGWGADFIVHPQYRRKSIAITLQKMLISNVDAYMNILMAPATVIIGNKLGAINCPPVLQLILPIKPELRRVLHYFYLRTFSKSSLYNKILRQILKRSFIQSIFIYSGLAFIIQQYWKFNRNVPPLKGNYYFEIVDHNNNYEITRQIIDNLWLKHSKYYDNLACRDWTNVSWKYLNHPFKKHFFYLLRKNQDYKGYFVLRIGDEIENSVGIISDMFFDPHDSESINEMINFIINYFVTNNVEYIYCCTSLSVIKKGFEKKGFKIANFLKPSFLSQKKELYDLIKNHNNWFLTFSDDELDRYPIRGK